ncbi:hypothetical protein DYU11_21760 [Fibrisoma montanum]|uniref:Lipocalin-like domain-containing protein n=1 Tax=Fibrisoma montanum TaxID=2305895 RepID=A0A418M4R9_9BACT|nr:hypothetical protein [Fibrisoma montanum]RIV20664.1 hypothetical protein DYU11_21760 [Fibrisoma montanum]
MNRTSTLSLWSILLGLLLFAAACDKPKDGVEPQTGQPGNGTSVPSFVGKKWQMTAFTLDPAIDLDGDGKLDSDLTRFLRACDLDNTVTFERGGKMTGDAGRLRCDDSTDPSPVKPSTWSYDDQSKKLRIIDGQNPTDVSEWTVVESSSSTLKVKVSITEDGQAHAAFMTWKSV